MWKSVIVLNIATRKDTQNLLKLLLLYN